MSKKDFAIVELTAPSVASVTRRLKGVQGSADKILTRAISRAVDNIRSNSAKAVSQKYRVQQKTYKEKQKVFKSSMYGEVKVTGQKFSILPGTEKISKMFKATPKKPQPSNPPLFYKSQILKDGGLQQLAETEKFSKPFIANLPYRGLDFYKRVKGKKTADETDTLIYYRGLSTAQMLVATGKMNDIKNSGIETMNKRIAHEINYLLGGIK